MKKYNTYTLDNGLRIIHLPSVASVTYCGYQINAGTRNQSSLEDGMAHFCEHVTFKGTTSRSAYDILNCLEIVGGELNAFTTKEDTVYYAAILKEHTPRAVDLLTDIVFHSVYPQKELDKEKEVVCDEIESYNDSPSELIYDDFENIIFKGHSIGRNILGDASKVRAYTTEDVKRFANRFYKPENSIFFCYGDIDFQQLVEQLKQATSDFPSKTHLKRISKEVNEKNISKEGEQNPFADSMPEYIPQHVVRDLQTHQAHVMIGCRAYDVHNSKRMPLYLLNNILGGPGMNSRLNLSLREKHALVYTVDSTMVSYSDTGIWAIYFGCDPDDVQQCKELVRQELDRIMQQPLTQEQLQVAKQQIKGQIGVACDNRESFALDFGKSFLHYGWEKDITNLYKHIDEITSEQIQQVAQELFAESNLSSLIFR